MPIKTLPPIEKLPEIGRLRKGAPNDPNTNRPGEDLTYFRFTAPEQALVDQFYRIYGPEPDTLNIYLPYPTMEENFPAWMMEYTRPGLQTKCDRETIHFSTTKQEIGTPCRQTLPNGSCNCKENGLLNMVLTDLNRWGIVKLSTNSIYDIVDIQGVLANLERFAGNYGANLSQIPMVLSRHMKEVPATFNGKRQLVEKSLLRIEPLPDWVRQAREQKIFPWTQPVLESYNPRLLNEAPAPEAEIIDPATGEVMDYDPTDEQALEAEVLAREQAEALTQEYGYMELRQQMSLWQLILKAGIKSLDEASQADLEKICVAINKIKARISEKENRVSFLDFCLDGIKKGTIDKTTFEIVNYAEVWSKNLLKAEDDLPF